GRDRSRTRRLGLKSAGPRRAASCGIKPLPCEQFRQRSPVRHNPWIGLHNPVMLPYRLWPPLRFAGKGEKERREPIPAGFPALVLNADFRPLSYYPLSLWSWQDAIKAVFLERVNIVAQYDRAVRSPSLEMKLPSVVSLKTFVKPATQPAFTRFNVFLRDKFS